MAFLAFLQAGFSLCETAHLKVPPTRTCQLQVWVALMQTLQWQPSWALQVVGVVKDEHPAAVPVHPQPQPQPVHVLPVPMVEQGTLLPVQLKPFHVHPQAVHVVGFKKAEHMVPTTPRLQAWSSPHSHPQPPHTVEFA
jgi:hypothetical protein